MNRKWRNEMNAPANIQVITGPDGKPAFVVIPYADYIAEHGAQRAMIPHAVVSRTVDGATPVRAWRATLQPGSASRNRPMRSKKEASACAETQQAGKSCEPI